MHVPVLGDWGSCAFQAWSIMSAWERYHFLLNKVLQFIACACRSPKSLSALVRVGGCMLRRRQRTWLWCRPKGHRASRCWHKGNHYVIFIARQLRTKLGCAVASVRQFSVCFRFPSVSTRVIFHHVCVHFHVHAFNVWAAAQSCASTSCPGAHVMHAGACAHAILVVAGILP
jgi:hypothetical protein